MLKRVLLALGLVLALCLPGAATAPQPDTRPHPSNLRFNKLRIGTLVNCGANNFVTGFDPRTSAPVCLQPSLSMLSDVSSVVTTTGAQKVFGKQNVSRVVTQTIIAGSPDNFTVNCDTTSVAVVPTLTAAVAVNVPVCTGTNPEDEQTLLFRFAATAAPRAITWNASGFSAENGIPLPTSTTGDGSTRDRFLYAWNSVSARWGLVASTKGAVRGITTLASNATYTCDPAIAESCEMQNTLTAGTGVTMAITAGSYPNGMKVLMRIRCTGAQALTLPTGTFLGSPNVPLIGITCDSNSYWKMLGFIFSGVDVKWQLHAVN
jgi:hypothetical protein